MHGYNSHVAKLKILTLTVEFSKVWPNFVQYVKHLWQDQKDYKSSFEYINFLFGCIKYAARKVLDLMGLISFVVSAW
jgi:hypothetical protein